MAEALESSGEQQSEDPPYDPSLVALRYRHHRRRRRQKIVQRQERWLARYRYYVVLGVLVAIGAGFVVATLHEIHRLFGL